MVEYYGCSGKYRQFAAVFCEILLIILIFKISLTERCFLKLCLGINAEQFDAPIVTLNYNLCFILCCASNYRTIIYAVFGIMNMKQIHPLKLKFKIHLVEKPALPNCELTKTELSSFFDRMFLYIISLLLS